MIEVRKRREEKSEEKRREERERDHDSIEFLKHN